MVPLTALITGQGSLARGLNIVEVESGRGRVNSGRVGKVVDGEGRQTTDGWKRKCRGKGVSKKLKRHYFKRFLKIRLSELILDIPIALEDSIICPNGLKLNPIFLFIHIVVII